MSEKRRYLLKAPKNLRVIHCYGDSVGKKVSMMTLDERPDKAMGFVFQQVGREIHRLADTIMATCGGHRFDTDYFEARGHYGLRIIVLGARDIDSPKTYTVSHGILPFYPPDTPGSLPILCKTTQDKLDLARMLDPSATHADLHHFEACITRMHQHPNLLLVMPSELAERHPSHMAYKLGARVRASSKDRVSRCGFLHAAFSKDGAHQHVGPCERLLLFSDQVPGHIWEPIASSEKIAVESTFCEMDEDDEDEDEETQDDFILNFIHELTSYKAHNPLARAAFFAARVIDEMCEVLGTAACAEIMRGFTWYLPAMDLVVSAFWNVKNASHVIRCATNEGPEREQLLATISRDAQRILNGFEPPPRYFTSLQKQV